MADKCDEVLSIKVSSTIKKEYQALSDAEKKTAKRLILDALCQYMWGKNHYDPEFYFKE